VLAADNTDQIAAAWAIKELLRRLLAARDPADICRRLHDFHAAYADMSETTRLATTIETWWPAVLVFLRLHVFSARAEGFTARSSAVRGVSRGRSASLSAGMEQDLFHTCDANLSRKMRLVVPATSRSVFGELLGRQCVRRAKRTCHGRHVLGSAWPTGP
jgi:DNA-binding GntR family transcriptional regulator